ncbi:MAG: xylose isomerase, partial [Rhizobiaceae bacterium]|nr:xylose isomerase [Rhizobiaceae bacterium]
DACARGLKAAAKMIEDKALSGPLDARYAGWDSSEGQKLARGEYSLEQIAEWVEAKDINPQPKSGKQELLENIVNRYV